MTNRSRELKKYAYGLTAAAVTTLAADVGATRAHAQSIDLGVANHSFESPPSIATGGIFPEADGWIETGPIDGDPPQFPGFEVPPGGPFTLDTGVFYNSQFVTNPTPPPDLLENPAYVTNALGVQLAYLFAKDDAEISFQQTPGVAYRGGARYTLAVGVGRSFFLPPINANGGVAEMALRLVYEDDFGELQTVSEQVIDASEVGDGTTIADFPFVSGILAQDHPAVGRDLTLWIGPTAGTSGVWILDNVRLSYLVAGDLNGDSFLDAFDVSPIELALADPAAFEANYPGIDANAAGDFNDDGVLDAFDIAHFEAALAAGASSAHIPEPASAAVIALGVTAAMSRRKRRA